MLLCGHCPSHLPSRRAKQSDLLVQDTPKVDAEERKFKAANEELHICMVGFLHYTSELFHAEERVTRAQHRLRHSLRNVNRQTI